MRTDMKQSASPKRHGVSQPVIKITATSSTVSSLNLPTPIMYMATETRGESPRLLTHTAERAMSPCPRIWSLLKHVSGAKCG